MTPSKPLVEAERLRVLRSYRILDTMPESSFDGITEIAAYIAGTDYAYISLIDSSRQWFKSKVGIGMRETPREFAMCSYAILTPHAPLIVRDASADPRFATNPFVIGPPHVRFYAGFPLVNPSGFALGTLCVLENEPRDLEPGALASLKALARQVVSLLELRRTSDAMADALERVRALRSMVPICSHCRKVRADGGDDWQAIEGFLRQYGAELSHGICPSCLRTEYGLEPGDAAGDTPSGERGPA